MGIKELILKNEENILKAMVYIDKQNNVKVEYKNFTEIEMQYSNDDIVRVFKPKKEDLEWLTEILTKRAEIGVDKTMEAEFNAEEIYEMMTRFTDLDLGLDLSKMEDREKWIEILATPFDVLLFIKREIESIAYMVCKLMIDNFKEIMDMPDEFKQAMIDRADIKNDLKKVERIIKPKEKAKPNRVKNKTNNKISLNDKSDAMQVIDNE